MDLGYDVIVTITGIVLVFLILVLLMAIITLEGKIFDAMNGKKAAAKAASAAKPAAPVKQAAAPALLYGQRQVCAEGSPPRQEWLGQGWRQRHHRTLLTQEEKHDSVY